MCLGSDFDRPCLRAVPVHLKSIPDTVPRGTKNPAPHFGAEENLPVYPPTLDFQPIALLVEGWVATEPTEPAKARVLFRRTRLTSLR